MTTLIYCPVSKIGDWKQLIGNDAKNCVTLPQNVL